MSWLSGRYMQSLLPLFSSSYCCRHLYSQPAPWDHRSVNRHHNWLAFGLHRYLSCRLSKTQWTGLHVALFFLSSSWDHRMDQSWSCHTVHTLCSSRQQAVKFWDPVFRPKSPWDQNVHVSGCLLCFSRHSELPVGWKGWVKVCDVRHESSSCCSLFQVPGWLVLLSDRLSRRQTWSCRRRSPLLLPSSRYSLSREPDALRRFCEDSLAPVRSCKRLGTSISPDRKSSGRKDCDGSDCKSYPFRRRTDSSRRLNEPVAYFRDTLDWGHRFHSDTKYLHWSRCICCKFRSSTFHQTWKWNRYNYIHCDL